MTSRGAKHIELYDTTLRDGMQGQNVAMSLPDKLRTVLVPVDFSSTSAKAVEEAIALVESLGGRLILYHVLDLSYYYAPDYGAGMADFRVVEGDHDVDCKVDGMGVMLKAKFLKKA